MKHSKSGTSVDQVQCKFCDRSLEIITSVHLAVHETTRQEYMEQFQLEPYQLISRDLRIRMARRADYRPFTKPQLLRLVRALMKKYPDKGFVFFERNHHQVAIQASKQYGGWRKAVLAAGFETWLGKRHREWTKKRVLAEIRKLHKETGSVALGRDDSKEKKILRLSAIRFYGRWKNAVKAAGFDLKDFYVKGEWTKRDTLNCIRRARIRQNLSEREYFLLSSACKIHFGGVEEALEAAGYSWEAFFGRKRLSRDVILAELAKFKAEYGKDCARQIKKEAPWLAEASPYYFSRWSEALEIAGIKPLRRKWTKNLFKEEVKGTLTGKPTNIKYAMEHCPWLIHPAHKFYGSWPKAIEECGLEWNSPRFWKREDLIAAVKALGKDGSLQKQTARADDRLKNGVYYHFGGWKGAADAAGLKYRARVMTKWSKERVISEIRNLPRRSDGRIAVGATENFALYGAAIRYVGGWKKAVSTALGNQGLDR